MALWRRDETGNPEKQKESFRHDYRYCQEGKKEEEMSPVFPTIPTALITQVFNNYAPGSYAGDGRHKGIDYGDPVGNPIYACMSGVVEVAQNQQTGYGRHVRLRHSDGSLSIYGHLSTLLVKVGDQVREGQTIGKSGGDPRDAIDGDGYSTGAHLHWEIRPAGVNTDQGAVDPNQYCLQYVPAKWDVAECSAAVGLNVRSSPTVGAPVLYTLKRREIVRVVEQVNGWARLHALRPEWCSLAYLSMTGQTGETTAVSTVTLPELSDSDKLDRLWAAHPELH